MSTTTAAPLKTEAQPDANYVSFNRDTVTLYAGTSDEEHLSTADGTARLRTDENGQLLIVPFAPKQWETALKISGREFLSLRGLRIAQCKEAAVDINNRAAHITLQGEFGVVGEEGEQVVVTKGGSHDIALMGPIHSRGRRADVVAGGWSDQSHEPSYNLNYRHLYRATGGTVTFVFGRVKQPIRAALGRAKHIQLPDGAKVLFWRSLGEQVYWWGKWAAVKLGLIKGRH